MNKNFQAILCLLVSLSLVSCQSAEERAAQAKAEAEKAEQALKEKKFQEALQKLPPLYKVTWKICNINHGTQNPRCDETKEPSTKGYSKPVLLWGPAGEFKLIKSRDFFSGSESHLFVKSRGCLSSGKLQDEQFIKVKSFVRGKNMKEVNIPEPSVNVKVEPLSAEEKENAIRLQIKIAEIERYGSPMFLGDDYECRTLDEWNKRL